MKCEIFKLYTIYVPSRCLVLAIATYTPDMYVRSYNGLYRFRNILHFNCKLKHLVNLHAFCVNTQRQDHMYSILRMYVHVCDGVYGCP